MLEAVSSVLPPQAARDRTIVRDRPQAANFFRMFIIVFTNLSIN